MNEVNCKNRFGANWITSIRNHACQSYWAQAITALVVLMLCACVDIHRSQNRALPIEKFITYANSDLELIPGNYLVVFDSAAVSETSVSALANSLVAGTRGKITYVFTSTLRGFAVMNLTDTWANAVSTRSDVSFVRKDFRIYGKELRGSPWGPVPWNLDRVDQRAPFSLDRDFRFKTGPVATNPPVPIYILDNGIYQDHQEFAIPGGGSRVENVADVTNTNFARCDGHGTQVASIAAGATFGITPTLIKNIKVLTVGPFGCTAGSFNTVQMGLDKTFNHMSTNNITKAVVNLSLGFYVTNTQDLGYLNFISQIQRLQNRGVIIVAAAGNENKDAAGLTPANLPNVLAVGATTQSDERLIFSATYASNFGSTIALWAPGYNIKAADWPINPDSTATYFASGTSVAAPHIAGAAALLWQQHPSMSANEVMNALRARATRDMLTKLGPGSINALLYVGEDAPTQGSTHLISRSGSDGDLQAVKVSTYNRTQVYVAGSGAEPYAYAEYDTNNLSSGPSKKVVTTYPAIYRANITTGSGLVYFSCIRSQAGTGEGVVIATKSDDVTNTLWQHFFGPGSMIAGITYGYPFFDYRHTLHEKVFVIATRPKLPPEIGSEVFITSLDAEDGHQVNTVVLTAPGFTEQFHQAVDLVLVDVALDNIGYHTSTDLVAATYNNQSRPNKTFLWKLNPNTLQVIDWREVPAPSFDKNGMSATALAVQPLEDNMRGISIPGEVFLTTVVFTSSDKGIVPCGYIYRLDPDRVTARNIEVVRNAFISSLWSEEGDLYFAGVTTLTFPPGNLFGTSKLRPYQHQPQFVFPPGYLYGSPALISSPEYDAFLGKSEGIVNSRRWMLTFNPPGAHSNSGYGGYGAHRGYIVGSDPSMFYVVEYPVY